MAAGDPGVLKRNFSATAIQTTLVNSLSSAASGDVTTGVGVGAGPQSGQSLAIEQVVPQSYSPNNPPTGLLTVIIEPPKMQCFLLEPTVKFGD